MRDLLHRLAAIEPSNLPVLSVYLDLRPQATGQNPAIRSGLIVLKDRLREIEKTFLPRGPDLDSLRADSERIESFLQAEAAASTQGLALFACNDRGLFETLEAGVPFENQVTVGAVPDLFQLARLLDEQETAVVAVVDTNTARLFVTRSGRLERVGESDDDSVHFRKRSSGGWSQARYQRHIEKHRTDFAGEVADAIDRLIDREGAVRLILAGDEVVMTPLQNSLSSRASDLLHDVQRIHIRAPRTEIAAEVAPALAQAEAAAGCQTADQLISAVRSGGLGTTGLENTQRALRNGQVDELLLDPEADLDDHIRNDLIRLATTTGANVEMVPGHSVLQQLGGVGALLRYRLDEY